MSRNLTILSAFVLAFPIAIEAPYDSGGASGHATRISVGGGAGYYALITRDCEGTPSAPGRSPFATSAPMSNSRSMGRSTWGFAEERYGRMWHIRRTPYPGGSQVQSARYVNPYLALESRHVGIGWGPIFSRSHPRGSRQIGRAIRPSRMPPASAAICASAGRTSTSAPA